MLSFRNHIHTREKGARFGIRRSQTVLAWGMSLLLGSRLVIYVESMILIFVGRKTTYQFSAEGWRLAWKMGKGLKLMMDIERMIPSLVGQGQGSHQCTQMRSRRGWGILWGQGRKLHTSGWSNLGPSVVYFVMIWICILILFMLLQH